MPAKDYSPGPYSDYTYNGYGSSMQYNSDEAESDYATPPALNNPLKQFSSKLGLQALPSGSENKRIATASQLKLALAPPSVKTASDVQCQSCQQRVKSENAFTVISQPHKSAAAPTATLKPALKLSESFKGRKNGAEQKISLEQLRHRDDSNIDTSVGAQSNSSNSERVQKRKSSRDGSRTRKAGKSEKAAGDDLAKKRRNGRSLSMDRRSEIVKSDKKSASAKKKSEANGRNVESERM